MYEMEQWHSTDRWVAIVDEATKAYIDAFDRNPQREDLGVGVFMSHVRQFDFKQQQLVCVCASVRASVISCILIWMGLVSVDCNAFVEGVWQAMLLPVGSCQYVHAGSRSQQHQSGCSQSLRFIHRQGTRAEANHYP
jgi:hypothetical protein